jgi:hypothetical protein
MHQAHAAAAEHAERFVLAEEEHATGRQESGIGSRSRTV